MRQKKCPCLLYTIVIFEASESVLARTARMSDTRCSPHLNRRADLSGCHAGGIAATSAVGNSEGFKNLSSLFLGPIATEAALNVVGSECLTAPHRCELPPFGRLEGGMSKSNREAASDRTCRGPAGRSFVDATSHCRTQNSSVLNSYQSLGFKRWATNARRSFSEFAR